MISGMNLNLRDSGASKVGVKFVKGVANSSSGKTPIGTGKKETTSAGSSPFGSVAKNKQPSS